VVPGPRCRLFASGSQQRSGMVFRAAGDQEDRPGYRRRDRGAYGLRTVLRRRPAGVERVCEHPV